jgi:hypothetical protein
MFTTTTRIHIRNQSYTFVANQYDPDSIFEDNSGSRARIYKLQNTSTGSIHALKVFKDGYRNSYEETNFSFFQQHIVHIPGLEWVRDRILITSKYAEYSSLVQQFPNLENAILMPWFDFQKINEIRDAIKNNTLQASVPKCRSVAQLITYSLTELEKIGIAHGDIASSNILIDWSNNAIAIIDIEDMFHNQINAPQEIFSRGSGTEGYRFSSSYTSWQVSADRFSGAIFISEILSLCDVDVQHNAAEESFFTQEDISTRHTAQVENSRFQVLYRALNNMFPSVSSLLKRTWQASSIETCPTLTDWLTLLGAPRQLPTSTQTISYTEVISYTEEIVTRVPYQRKANSDYPTLIVFLIDLSRSMFMYPENIIEKRIDRAINIVNVVVRELLNRSRKGNSFQPRYHIAMFGYHQQTVNLLDNEAYYFDTNLNNKTVKANYADAIIPIHALANFKLKLSDISDVISTGADNMDEGETHATQALETIYYFIQRNLSTYDNCHPPYIFHITDGANKDNGNPIALFDAITSLKTQYGNTLVSTAYIGEDLIAPNTNLKYWSGITNTTIFNGRREMWANLLRKMSSKMPDSYQSILRQDYGYTNLDTDAYLFFPGDNPEMIKLAVTASASTGQ